MKKKTMMSMICTLYLLCKLHICPRFKAKYTPCFLIQKFFLRIYKESRINKNRMRWHYDIMGILDVFSCYAIWCGRYRRKIKHTNESRIGSNGHSRNRLRSRLATPSNKITLNLFYNILDYMCIVLQSVSLIQLQCFFFENKVLQ